jgi:hypothetical protein
MTSRTGAGRHATRAAPGHDRANVCREAQRSDAEWKERPVPFGTTVTPWFEAECAKVALG